LSGIHNLSGKRMHRTDIYAVFKVDGIQKAKSKATRTKFNDSISLSVEKAQSLEILVFEEGDTLLAMFWCYISDLETSITVRRATLATVSLDRGNARSETELGVEADSRKAVADIYYVLELEPGGYIQCQLNLVPTVIKAALVFPAVFNVI
jgi:hypothetical protein